MNSKKMEETALDLPSHERAELARKLLLSLDELSEDELAEAWLGEADRRARELDRGEVALVPADEVRRKAATLLR